ncbi:hypothetical protein L486_03923 [Kwoniella mangroviensis CBS 10435]|uniref:Methyltransferase domain-containing protein n=1 Tax=Kwoniella mangroviensis CBS 10435 TaxID=1331196 RepID=A0A1B9IQU9_9TREE|nr:hypothetical protein L486_03923 [Kwoniella mangroviensis CBS 10435]
MTEPNNNNTYIGEWAIHIANTNPYSDVLGVDIDWRLMNRDVKSKYGNIDFAAVDVEEPLPWPRGSFDVIHVKGLLLEITNYVRLIEKLAMVLRPGGLLIITEVETSYGFSTGQELPRNLKQWDACVEAAFGSRGIEVDFPSRINHSIANSGVFAPNPYCQQLAVPAGSYMRGARRGQMHPQVLSSTLKKILSVLIEYGYNQNELENLIQSCLVELSNPQANYYQRLFSVYAIKIY